MLYRLLTTISLLGLLSASCGTAPVTEATETSQPVKVPPVSKATETSPVESTINSFLEVVKQSKETDLQSFGCIPHLEPDGTETLAGIQGWHIMGSDLKTAEKDSLARYAKTSVNVDIVAMGTTMQSRYVFSVWASDDFYEHLVRITEGISNPQRESTSLESYCIAKIEML